MSVQSHYSLLSAGEKNLPNDLKNENLFPPLSLSPQQKAELKNMAVNAVSQNFALRATRAPIKASFFSLSYPLKRLISLSLFPVSE